jgi:membrane associated rhomboid family serine protease
MADEPGTETAHPDVLHCYRHPRAETYVRCVRCDRPICPACMNEASVGFQCPECVREGRASVRTPQAVYGGRTSATPYVTFALIVINVAVFGVMSANGGVSIGFGTGGSQSTYARFALSPLQIATQHEYYRLFTSMFLHYGVTHILFNMLALYYVGPVLERMLGPVRFLVVYIVGGVGGSVLVFVAGSVGQLAAGASGAIFGLFGALFVVLRQQRLDPRGVISLVAINLVLGFVIPNVSVLGHVGGLIAGGLVTAGIVFVPRTKYRSLLQGLAVAVIAMVLIGATAARAHSIRQSPPRIPTSDAAAASADVPSRYAGMTIKSSPRSISNVVTETSRRVVRVRTETTSVHGW